MDWVDGQMEKQFGRQNRCQGKWTDKSTDDWAEADKVKGLADRETQLWTEQRWID